MMLIELILMGILCVMFPPAMIVVVPVVAVIAVLVIVNVVAEWLD